MRDYDAIVLAAGKNTRLRGVVPSYHKPLVIVNGRPLIVKIVADLVRIVKHTVVVVSPENCGAIAEVLRDNDLLEDGRVTLIVQPVSRGPGEATLRALRVVKTPRVLLVLGDNIIAQAELAGVVDLDATRGARHSITMAVVASSNAEQAERFTRVSETETGVELIEGRPGGADPETGVYLCWVGPMAFDAELGRTLFERAVAQDWPEREVKISGYFNEVEDLTVQVYVGGAVDIGESESLFRVNNNG